MTRLLLSAVGLLTLAACATERAPGDSPEGERQVTPLGGSGGGLLVDMDRDGVAADDDCDDNDEAIGALLYFDDFTDAAAPSTAATEALGDNWTFGDSDVTATAGGQQARLAEAASWGDVVIYGELSSEGTKLGCIDCEQVCGPYEPEDGCYTEWQAIGLGILEVETTGSGKITFTNTDPNYDVCLSAFQLWDNPTSQAAFLGSQGNFTGWNEQGEYVIPASGSLDFHYGSWTTANGRYERYLGAEPWWCLERGINLTQGVSYTSTGALLPPEIMDLIQAELDLDGDGVEDHVDWATSVGVQAQQNLWDYQNSHTALTVGKLMSTNSDGTVSVALTVQNRGVVAGVGDVLDTAPEHWSLVGCDVSPDASTTNEDGSTSHEWSVSLAGCSNGCTVVPETTLTCDYRYDFRTDLDIVEFPNASIAYDDGDTDTVAFSMNAVTFDYDRDGDGLVECGEVDRWRAGLLLRAELDADQGEGFHGYRCALASNSPEDCYDDGQFLQIGEFMDHEEDDHASECGDGCENPSFDQLARVDHDGSIDLDGGERASLSFWAVGDELLCVAEDSEGNRVSASASDDSFTGGTVGLSTLNMFGEFAWVRVCEANALPE